MADIASPPPDTVGDRPSNLWLTALFGLRRNRLALFGLAVILLLSGLAILAPILINNTPLYVVKKVEDPSFATSLIAGKGYYPIFFNYSEIDFSTISGKSVGRGFEQWMRKVEGESRRLKFRYEDERILMIFPPLQLSPISVNTEAKLVPPSLAHPLGTDDLGRDILTRILFGARISLAIGFISQFFALLIGIPLGLISGYYTNRKGPAIASMLGILITIIFALALIFITSVRSAITASLVFGLLTFLVMTLPYFLSPPIALFLEKFTGRPITRDFLHRYCLTADDFITWMVNVVSAFPFLLLVIAIVATVETPDIKILFVAIGIVGWVEIARLVRGQVLTIKEKEFIEAARSVGAGDTRILTLHILPNILAPIIVSVTLGIASSIMVEAGLSFLGMGVQPPYPTWGGMINDGRAFLENCPWIVLFPGCTIMLTVFSFNLLGDGLRDALDPKILKTRS